MTTRRGRTAVAVGTVAALVGLAGCSGSETISGSPDPTEIDLGDIRLVAHDSCDALLDWFHTEAGARVGPYGLEGTSTGPYPMPGMFLEDARGGPTSASSADAGAESAQSAPSDGGTSSTNTQEPGVGEPDLVWTDGTRLVTVVNQALQVVDLQAGTVTAELDLAPDSGGDSWYTPSGLLVEGDQAVVLQRKDAVYALDGVAGDVVVERSVDDDTGAPDSGPTTVLTRVDLGASPTVLGSIEVDGSYVDARMVDGVVRTVVRATPTDLGFVYPSGGSQAAVDRATAANREVVAASTLDDWLPSMTVTVGDGDPATGRAVECTVVDHPTTFAGFGVVTVVGLDLGSGAVEPLPSAAVVADAETVYSSSDALYVATTSYPGAYLPYDPDAGSSTTTSAPSEEATLRTAVHAFSLPADAAARYEASGAVPGTVVDQFALSELDGDLRVATTVPSGTWGTPIPVEDGPATNPAEDATALPVSESRITVLRRDGGDLATIGEVTGLGPTEQIRGVRFAGPTAYVVTFRQTDPLYVVDLADPTSPRVAGELKIPGYSSYLQVLDEGRVLGIGQDATDTGRTTGLQESLFDVSDPANPARLAQLVVAGASSTAEYDHHALLWWPAADLLAVPVERWGPSDGGISGTGVLVTRITDDAVTELGTIVHPASDGLGGVDPGCPEGANCVSFRPSPTWPTPIARTLVADGRLVTVSTAGVKVSDLSTLADLAWIPLS